MARILELIQLVENLLDLSRKFIVTVEMCLKIYENLRHRFA